MKFANGLSFQGYKTAKRILDTLSTVMKFHNMREYSYNEKRHLYNCGKFIFYKMSFRRFILIIS